MARGIARDIYIFSFSGECVWLNCTYDGTPLYVTIMVQSVIYVYSSER
jgi:hypothetical protein